jgi:hypothetical protein
MDTGRLIIAPTTRSMPSGLTCGAPARAERSPKPVGASAAATTTVCRLRATATSDPAVQIHDGEMIAMASKQAAAACQATAPSITVTERRSARVDTVQRAPAPPSMTAAYPP